MTAKPVIPRAIARADVELAVDHYAQEGGPDLAEAFIDALEQAYRFIGDTPASGSPRWAQELNVPGLRTVRIKGFSWRVFYVEFDAHVDVWRVVHAKRDMPAHMTDDE